ncbi:aspartyl/asparaginyl beta-hydroxylase domain-containing protein [Acidovorax sp. NCPPB 3576]|uniref:aspartyl/asparaginyl beta-hydroxylase domain-containing protein n=1 Tax=Acidovorax sp. NCPPB 3576 TaxID=2940488 RepID=UPI00234A488D|nr:aspartyl/asparaginyl beta-hydroxylase domain-containing protein [Acidovorax sp. NCPPB 3576]WCM90499.1 aspartyl/asparaginyl beta-hydroxylase domain-containing protein [Acidovorax sp. NCPPB 3576]
MIATLLILLAVGWIGSMAYVFNYRGQARYASLKQYLRKSWPVFALPNTVLYLFTRPWARGPFVKPERFSNLDELACHWEIIRDEALAMQARGGFEDPRTEGTPASFDLGFRTFYKYGWSRYYLSWYGYTYPSASADCPKTLEILSRFPDVTAAMFTVLPPRSRLSPHADPLACSLRYHLGLETPNSTRCFINVDGVEKSWQDGDAFVFDETYLHFVTNDTDAPRLILMCDIRRPMSLPGRIFNKAYSLLARTLQTPNDARDQRGLVSALFANLAPVLAAGRRIRERNRPLYNVLKWAVNLSLLCAVFGMVAAVVASVRWLLPA